MFTEKPTIQQVSQVAGKNIVLKNAQLEDAEFILALRLDPDKNKYLSPIDAEVEKQREWLRLYLNSQGQAYFVICDKSFNRLGTVRIYDAVAESFSWGSWILKKGAPASAAIESAVLVYHLATVCWGFQSAHFQVHRANASVLSFHKKFGAEEVAEISGDIQMRIGRAQIDQALRRYSKYLPSQNPVA